MNFKAAKIILQILLFAGFATNVIAQSPPERQNYLPKIIPSSPEAAMLQRFGNYNVNLFNGVPEISIPLYEINTGKLKVPITLSYHASGIRVRDEATFVGLGWNLSAGGSISRTVRSKPDEQLGYLNGSYTIRPSTDNFDAVRILDDLHYSNDAARGLYDMEPDIYSCNLPTMNSKFYYGNRSILQPVIIPFSSAKINTTLTGNDLSFSILDESGLEYKLGDSKEMYSSGTSSELYPTAWNLKQMISDDKTDSIYFNYADNSYNGGGGDYYDMTVVTDFVTNQPTNTCGSLGNCTVCPSTVSSTGGGQAYGIGSNVLQEIKFPQGKVVFELDGVNRLDIPNKSLKSVKVYSLDPVTLKYTLLKSYSFNYSYFINGTERRLKLTSLQLKDNLNVNIQTYTFTYNETNPLPLKASRERDYWGFYNKRTNNTLVPNTNIIILGTGGVNNVPATIGGPLGGREPDTLYNQVGMLTKITYPTGGNTEFTYETNRYLDNTSTVKFAGGLRIKQIKSTDNITGVSSYKTYKYGTSENGNGNIIIPVSLNFFSTEQFFYYSFNEHQTTRRIRTFSSNPNIGIEPFDGCSVGYSTVCEYNGTELVNAGKTIYEYSFVPDNYGYDLIEFNRPSIGSRHFERGLLQYKTDYKKKADGTFKKLQIVSNTYGAWPNTFSTDAVNLRLFEKNTYQLQAFNYGQCGDPPSYIQPYVYASYRITNGDNRLVSSTQKVFDEADESKFTTTTTNYLYQNYSHKQVTKVTTQNTQGQSVETLIRYPHDILAQTVPALTPAQQSLLNNMVTANMINKVIEKEEKLNGTTMTLVHNEFGNFGTNHYYPSWISTKTKTYNADVEITFNAYDEQGNLKKYTAKDGVEASFIWDYKLHYPVAKIAGASVENCAYSSFEADGNGGWNFTGKPVLESTPPTGKMVYDPALGQLTKTIVTAGVYTVSYWSKNGQKTVNATTAFSGRSLNGWTYYEHKVTLTANGTVTISGSGIIDELRLYPVGAQMSTYTYENLLGITAQCDLNNRISYYEYDGSQRLVMVRDQDRKILKKLSYNYAGEPENSAMYYNEPQGGIYTPACTPGYFGTAISFIVPAKTFSAATLNDANSLAIQYVQANAQDYVNRYGVCTAGITVNGYNAKTSFDYRVKFTVTGGSTSYTFTLPKTTQFTTLGVVPPGNYSVQFFPGSSSSTSATFVVNGLTAFASGGTTFTNVNINSTSTAYMY